MLVEIKAMFVQNTCLSLSFRLFVYHQYVLLQVVKNVVATKNNPPPPLRHQLISPIQGMKHLAEAFARNRADCNLLMDDSYQIACLESLLMGKK